MENGPDPLPPPPPRSPPRFKDRVAVVTGAARGIGRAHAVYLAREGCDLVLGDVLDGLPDGAPYGKATEADLQETIRLVEAEGVRCLATKMDVRDPHRRRRHLFRLQPERRNPRPRRHLPGQRPRPGVVARRDGPAAGAGL